MTTTAKTLHYCANFCEENIWQLAKQTDNPCHIVFISNPCRQVAFWQQQSAPPDQPLIWDYHVILLERRNQQILCYDLDSRLASPLLAIDYLIASFPDPKSINRQYQPHFKVISKQCYLQNFASNRQHMRQNQQWLSPPPAWPCIGINQNQPDNLQQFIDSNNSQWGERYSLLALLTELSKATPFTELGTGQ